LPETEQLTHRDRLLRAQRDPTWWIDQAFGHDLWARQRQIIESVRDHRITAVKSCHAAGKSFIAADVALWYLYTHVPSIVITTAPTNRQVEGILWKEIHTSFNRAIRPLGGTILSQELKIDSNWFAWGFTAPEYDPDRFQGFHEIHILVIVDEASGISEEIFSAIDGIMTGDEARLLLIGNPTNPSGRFAKLFKTPGVSKISIPAFATPNFTVFGITEEDIVRDTWEAKIMGDLPTPYLVTPRWVRERYLDWTPDSPLYQAKVLANFPESAEDTLIPLSWIEAAINRELVPGTPVELGVDIARYGSDKTVLVLRKGNVARIVEVRAKQGTMETAGLVKVVRERGGASYAKVDADGLGAGVYDRLEEVELEEQQATGRDRENPYREMHTGLAAADPERFGNTRAEWYWGLRQRFEEGDIDIEDDEELTAQLATLKYKLNSRGQIFIEKKEDMKKRGLPSPDKADALMLAFAPVPVTPEDEVVWLNEEETLISVI